MKIAVIGATGTAGQATVHAARQAGHETVALSRATGVNLHTGEGLAEGLAGADAVIDASNAFPSDPRADVVATFADATARLVAVCQQSDVRRLVHLSICNIDSPVFDNFSYYLAKRAQEQVLAASPLQHTIVRSAQWLEFALNPAAVVQTATEVRVEDWLIQPVAVGSVADVLVRSAAESLPDQQVAGLSPIRLPELTRSFLEATGDVRPVLVCEAVLPELAEGVLLAPAEATLLGPTLSEWLTQQSHS